MTDARDRTDAGLPRRIVRPEDIILQDTVPIDMTSVLQEALRRDVATAGTSPDQPRDRRPDAT